jgi:hypothetical protein
MVYRGGKAAANAYADCKTNAEEQGVRAATELR